MTGRSANFINSRVRLAATEVSIAHKAVELYLAGCRRHCPGCHNEELWDFSMGTPWKPRDLKVLRRKVETNALLVDKIWVLGGEPMDSPREGLVDFLRDLNTLGLPVWLWTSREYEQIPLDVLEEVAVVKTGEYRATEPGGHCWNGIELASRNQQFHVVR